MPLCPVCSTDNPDVARFCLSCGAALTSEPAREERKVVSVLFADLVGFTSRAEQLDPEDVRAVLAPYWERLRGELEQRGGTVEKFIGDAVMALFGAPVAHDDDPLRAVGAALAIRDWAREEDDLQVRIAVNTGEALVLLGARPAEGEGMAAGDVVNTTARLQSAAPVNGVLVGETTYRATRDVIEYAEHDPVVAKGKAGPIPVWEAVQVRSRLGVDVDRVTLPLVGRTRELGVIVDAFERAKAEREPQLVTLVGVPGIGKSRLVSAFFSRLEGQPELVWWRQGRALPYGDGVSFWALAEMIKAQAGIDENDDAETAAAKLRESVERIVDPDEQAWVLDHLLPLVGGDRGSGAGESAPAWRRYIEALAEQRPLVLVFEDMHWADDGLLDFVDHLVDWATGVPLLVLATARPELLDRRSAWGGGKLNVSTIALTPLSDDEAAQIIQAVLDRSALPAATQQALVERAGGNPLYAEQFARLYLERGSADDLPLPETVQGLIAARIDGLSAEEKRLLHDASVLGKVFWSGALAGEVVCVFLSLERKGMVRRERRSSVAGETQYAFRHVLVRDVAYGQIPRTLRGRSHLRAAEWIDALGRAEDHAELLAHHLGAARELGLDVRERARVAFRLAGDRASTLGSFPTARSFYARALELWPPDDSDRPRVAAGHARATFRATADTSAFESALAELERAGSNEEAAGLAAEAANGYWYGGDRAGAAAMVARGLALVDDESPAVAALLAERGRLEIFEGRAASGERDLARGLEVAQSRGLAEVEASILTTTGVLKMFDGELDAARRFYDRVIESAPLGSASRFRALSNRALVEFVEGDREAWAPYHAAAVAEARRAGDRSNLRWLETGAISELVDVGRWDEAVRRCDVFLAEGPLYADLPVMQLKALVHACRGELEVGRQWNARGLARMRELDDAQGGIPGRLAAAWTARVLGDDALASSLVAETVPLLKTSRHRPQIVGAFMVSAIAHGGALDRWRPWWEHVAATRRLRAARLAAAGDVVAAADAWAAVSPFDEAVGRLYAAEVLGDRAQLQRGLAFFRAVGAAKIVRDGEALLPASA